MKKRLTHVEHQRKWEAKNQDYMKRWKKSFTGYFKYTYSQIKGRCMSPSKPLYFGMVFMSKADWILFLKRTRDKRFELFVQWVENKYTRKYAPSIDRIDNKQGYLIDNCRWVTQSQNASAAIHKK